MSFNVTYEPDGTGRDHYINYNNGGFVNPLTSRKIGTYISTSNQKLILNPLVKTLKPRKGEYSHGPKKSGIHPNGPITGRHERPWTTTNTASYKGISTSLLPPRNKFPSRRIRPAASVHPYSMGSLFNYEFEPKKLAGSRSPNARKGKDAKKPAPPKTARSQHLPRMYDVMKSMKSGSLTTRAEKRPWYGASPLVR